MDGGASAGSGQPATGVRGRYRAFLHGEHDAHGPWLVAFVTARTVTLTLRKFKQDRCFTHAASLAYATLVALVPISVLAFTFFTAFQRYAELRKRAEEAIFAYFVPSVGEHLVTLLDQVSRNIRTLSLPGLLLFLFAATVLFNSLENSFNAIWGVKRNRGLASKLLLSWGILTLVPVLLGAGAVLADRFQLEHFVHAQARTAITFLFTWAAFFLVLHLMPYTETKPMASLAGSFFGVCVWLGSRTGFVLYVSMLPIRTALGAGVSTILLFLMWVYFSWVVLLFSAELAYAIQFPRTPEQERRASAIIEQFKAYYSVLVLVEIGRRYRAGLAESSEAGVIAEEIGIPATAARQIIEDLLRDGLVLRTDTGGLVPARPIHELSLADVFRSAQQHVLAAPEEHDGPMREQLRGLFQDANQDTFERLDHVTIATLLNVEIERRESLQPE